MRLPLQLLRRKADSHKGDYGRIFILAGSARFSGAAILCSMAALRSGAGLVTLGIPKSLNNAIIKIKPPEVMTLPLEETKDATLAKSSFKKIIDFLNKADVLVIGPGLSDNKETAGLIRKVINRVRLPVIIDADGLNALAGHLDILRKKKALVNRDIIITPHPGEMARLLDKTISFVQKDRKNIAKSFAKNYNCLVILKGNKTIIAAPEGKAYINNTGNPGMATAGSGDCLTGIIAAFLGQKLKAPEASRIAVYIHGLAGDLAAEEKTQISLIASDIIDKIPEVLKKMRVMPA
ncbi:MAG: NAD(P)H-hydrate dehydratase [Candidatus Omnitrophica bacterium]|nr:NAD(P)H-hydrate dehydratase [Candidatus Omnitrophota bacterium]